MICPQCKREEADGALFCSVCGCRMDGKRRCPSCKAWIDGNSLYCPQCGKRTDGKVICPACHTAYVGKFCPTCGRRYPTVF